MRLSPDQISELGLSRDISTVTRFPDQSKPEVILCTDLEGPFVLGDPVAELMAGRVLSQSKLGSRLYQDIYMAYNRQRSLGRYHSPLAQEAGDTIIAMAVFLAEGITDADMTETAGNSKPTPGGNRVLDFINSNGGFAVAITSAPESMYRQQTLAMGFREIFGAPFPLDAVRKFLTENGRLDQELAIVRKFMADYGKLLAEPHLTPARLDERIIRYLEQDLGITYDRDKRSDLFRTPTTVIGQVLESEAIIGDDAKAAIAGETFNGNSNPDTVTLTVTMGDGDNDRKMLRTKGRLGIAVNGPGAVLDANIGIITPDIGDVLVPMFEYAMKEPDAPAEEIIKYTNIHLSQRGIHGALVHAGGPDVPDYLIGKHRSMKNYLRGSNILY